jgi:hypothetical protein
MIYLTNFFGNGSGFLISWNESSNLELAAETVLCLTPNLIWAEISLEKILKNINDNSKRFRYIIYAKDRQETTEAIERAKTIITEARKSPKIRDNDGIGIVFLTHDRSGPSPHYWSAKGSSLEAPNTDQIASLPVPTDIVVYKDIRDTKGLRTVAVMSVMPIDEKVAADEIEHLHEKKFIQWWQRPFGSYKKAFDIQLEDPDHYSPIERWFDEEWKLRTAD